jgi:hypothetical protein
MPPSIARITGSFTYVTAAAPPPARGSTYTAAGALGSATVECSTLAGFNSWIDNSTCNENANFQCQVLPGAQVMVQTCTPSRTGSAGSYAWTGGASAVSCLANPGFGSTWDNASTCTEVAGTMACRQDPLAVFVYDTTFPLPTCTQTRSGTAGSYVWTGGATQRCARRPPQPDLTPTSTCTERRCQCQVAGTQANQTRTFSRTGSAGLRLDRRRQCRFLPENGNGRRGLGPFHRELHLDHRRGANTVPHRTEHTMGV